MGMFRSLTRITKKLGAGKLLKAGMKMGARSIPLLSTAYAAYDISKELMGGAIPNAPALPALPAPKTKKKGFITTGKTGPSVGAGGIVPFWRGAGGGMQLPWNDPSVHKSLRQFALDDSAMRVMYRAPRGYVVVRDEKGRPYPLQKWVARKIGWWSPSAKPPMSATEWKSLKRAGKVVRTLKKMNGIAKKVANYDPRRTVKVDAKGRKV